MKETNEETMELSLLQKFVRIRSELKVPKEQRNDFGNYDFRSCEDILEKLKPLELKYNVVVVLSDDVHYIPLSLTDEKNDVVMEEVWDDESKRVLRKEKIEKGRFYIEATATLYDCYSDKTISNKAYAREDDFKKGMDASQITGTASSYARKYALSGLFGLDDVKDADTNEYAKITGGNKDTMSKEDAENYIFPGGKYKNKTMKYVYEKHPDYLEWLVKNDKANPTVKKCIEILQSQKTEDRVGLLKEMKDLELKTDSSHEKVLDKYDVKSDTELSIEQIKDAIETMKKFAPVEEMRQPGEVTPYDF